MPSGWPWPLRARAPFDSDGHFGLRGSPHHHLNFTQVARVDRLWLLGASGFLASQRRLVFQDNMGAAGRNDTVPEMGFGVWCWTGERATLIRRIPRPDRVMPVAQQRKDLGLGGGFMLQAKRWVPDVALPQHCCPSTAPRRCGLEFARAGALSGLFSDRSSRSLPRLFDRSLVPPRHLFFSPCSALATVPLSSLSLVHPICLFVFTNIFPHRQCLDKLLNRRLNLEATLIIIQSLNRLRSY